MRALLVLLLLPGAWPMFQGDDINRGSGDDVVPEAQEWWSWSAGARVDAAPVSAEGIVVIADWAGKVTALDAASGRPVWSHDMKDPIVSTPAIGLGWLYVADTKGDLVALDLHDGNVMASAQPGATRAPLTLKEGKLYVGNEAGQMRAFTATSLDLLWTFDVKDAQEVSTFNNATGITKCTQPHPVRPIRTAAAVLNGVVVFGSMNHYVYGVDEMGAPDGTTSLLWRHRTSDIVLSSPVIDPGAGRVFVAGYDEELRSLSVRPAAAGSDPCFGLKASPAWSFRVPGPVDAGKVHSTPAFDGTRLYFGTNHGAVHAVEATTGTAMWKTTVGGPVLASPVVGGDVLVVGSDDGIVYWLATGNGSVLATFKASAPVKAGAAILEGTVIVASEDGQVHRLGGTPPARPDLTIVSMEQEGKGLTITVRNVGAAASGPTVLQVRTNLSVQEHEVAGLAPGAEVQVFHLVVGNGTVEAEIDPAKALLEADRGNNRAVHAPAPAAVVAAPSGGTPWWPWVLAGVVLAGAAAGALWWWRREPARLFGEGPHEPEEPEA